MTELIPTAMQTPGVLPSYADGRVPFGFAPDEFTAYAQDKGLPRAGTISSARNRPVVEFDLDYAPVEPEETFVAENAQERAAAQAPGSWQRIFDDPLRRRRGKLSGTITSTTMPLLVHAKSYIPSCLVKDHL